MSDESVDMAALARDLVYGAGNAFWCNRVRAYVTKDQCVAGYLHYKNTDKKIPCTECSKVRLWAKNQNPVKKRSLRTARVPQKIQEKRGMAVKKESKDKMVDLVVDFTGRPDLMQGLKASAKENFRTPEQQVLFLIHNHILGKKAHAKKVA